MADFTMTAEHLARTLATTRSRERFNICATIEALANVELEKGELHTHDVLQELAESIKSEAPRGALTTAAPPPPSQEKTDLDDLDVPDALPPVLHRDDNEEGEAIARSLLRR